MMRILLLLTLFLGSIGINAQYFTEDFENGGTFPAGWTLTNGVDDWQIGDGSDFGPGSAHGGTYAAYFDDYNYSFGTTADMVTPVINLSGATAPQLKFWFDDAGSDDVEVLISTDNVTFTSIYTTPTSTITWEEQVVDISSYAGQSSVYIAFRGTSVYGTSNPHIDDIIVEEGPTCPSLTNIYADNIDSNYLSLHWSAGTNDVSWEIRFDTAGFTLSQGNFATANDTFANINSLSPNTEYEFYVRGICGVGDTGAWVGPISATTLCGAYIPMYTENFSSYLPDCWEEATGGLTTSSNLVYGSSFWTSDGFGNVGSTGAARMEIYSTGRDEWLISPSIDLGNGSTTYQIEFDVALTVWNTTATDTLQADDTLALVISTDNGTTWSTTNILNVWEDGNEPSATGSRFVYNLTGYTGVVKFGFYAASTVSGEDVNVYIDNFRVREVPTCFEPDSLYIASFNDDSVTLGWNNGNFNTTWQIEYGVSGFTQGTGSILNTATNPATINGLMGNTDYDFYVKGVCTPGDSSLWIGPISATTLCSPNTPSYLENFTTYLPDCWEEATGGLTTNSSLTYGSSNWIADGFANVGTTGSARMEIFSTGRDEWLISPSIDLGNGSTPYQLEFDVALTVWNSTAADTLQADDTLALVISTDNGQTWSSTNILNAWVDGNEPSATGDHVIYDLTSYTGKVKFGFYAASTVSGEDVNVYIDNFWVREVPTCDEPDSLHIVHTGIDSVTVSWNGADSNINYVVEYGPTGFVQDSGTIAASPTNTFGLAGLTGNTSYDFYVRGVCNGGDSSIWVGPLTVTTLCDIEVAPYVQNFDAMTEGTASSSCYTNEDLSECWYNDNSATNMWSVNSGTTNSTGTGPSTDNTSGSGKYIYVEASSCLSTKSTAYTPAIDLTALTVPALNFAYHMYGGDMGTLTAFVSNDGGATWNAEWTLSGDQGNSWKQAEVILNAYAGDTIQIKFEGFTGTAFESDIAIDDVQVDEAPSCPKVTNLATSGLYYDSVNITWTNGLNDSAWIIEYGTTGFNLGAGTNMSTTNPSTLNGLTPNTSYDVYVRSICTVGDTSAWVGPLTFTTLEVCPTVDSVDITVISFDSASVSWSAGAFDSSYIIEYDTTGFALGTGNVVNTTSNPYFLTGLTDNTTYQVYIRSICSVTDSSTVVGPFTFTTPCGIFTPDYFQDFSTGVAPDCWEEAEGLLSANTTFTSSFSDWTADGFANSGSTGSAKIETYSGFGSVNGWLISPSIDLGNGSTDYIVEFDIALTEWLGTTASTFDADDKLHLIISTDNGATWSNSNILMTFDNTTTISNTGDYQYFDLSTQPYTGVVKLALYFESPAGSSDNDLFIDNFNVVVKPTCPKLTNLSVSNATSNSVDLSWTNGSNDISWMVEYGAAGFTQGTGTTVSAGTNPFTLTGLSPDIAYDFYVRGICGAGDSSTWIGPVTDTTVPLCAKAPNFSLLVADSNKINVGWNLDASNTDYILEYGPTGFTPGTGTVVTLSAPDNFYSATGLNSLTEYDFYMTTICVSGDTSAVDGPYTYKTSCGSFAPIPYTEDFTSYVPECWTEAEGELTSSSTLTVGTSDWRADDFANVGSDQSASINIWSTRNDWLISPSFNLGSDANKIRFVEFDIAQTEYNGTAFEAMDTDDTLAFVISTDNGQTWSTSNILLQYDNSTTVSNTGEHVIYQLSGYTGSVKFGFYGASGTSSADVEFFVDNFVVRDSSTVGINENSLIESQFSVYPNPNNGEFNIQNNGIAINTTITIMDISGKTIKNYSRFFSNGAKENINLTNYESGVYILRVNKNGVVEQHKIIIQ